MFLSLTANPYHHSNKSELDEALSCFVDLRVVLLFRHYFHKGSVQATLGHCKSSLGARERKLKTYLKLEMAASLALLVGAVPVSGVWPNSKSGR